MEERKYQEGIQFKIQTLRFSDGRYTEVYHSRKFTDDNVARHLQLGEKVTLMYDKVLDYRLKTEEGYISLFMDEEEVDKMIGDQVPKLPTKEIPTIEVLQQLNDWTPSEEPKSFKRINTGVVYEFGVNTKGTKGLKYYAQDLPQYTIEIPLEEKFIEIDTPKLKKLEQEMEDLRQEQHELRTKLGQIAERKLKIRAEIKEIKNI